jgi:hypothetical protein
MFVRRALHPTLFFRTDKTTFIKRAYSSPLDKTNQVAKTVKRLAQNLEENNIDYCLMGGNALAMHGYILN